MFPMVLPLPRTSISFGTGAECFLAHTGSASIVSGLRVGAFPSNGTVPGTDDAASATPGRAALAPNPAARHNLGVLRILCLLRPRYSFRANSPPDTPRRQPAFARTRP